MVRNLKSFSLLIFFFVLACEQILVKTHTIKGRFVIGSETYTVCRRVRALFSPELVEDGGKKGVKCCLPNTDQHYTLLPKQLYINLA